MAKLIDAHYDGIVGGYAFDLDEFALKEEEQTRLFRRLKYMDKDDPEIGEIVNQLVLANLKLVYKYISDSGLISSIKSSSTIGREDLENESFIILRDLVLRFDPDRGYKFTTFVYNNLRGPLETYIAQHAHGFKLSTRHYKDIKKAKAIQQRLEQERSDPVNHYHVAAETSWSPEKTRELLNAYHVTLSLDEPVGEDHDEAIHGASLYDFHEDEKAHSFREELELKELNDYIAHVVNKHLTPEEKYIYRLRTEEERPPTFEVIGQQMGKSAEYARIKFKSATLKIFSKLSRKGHK